MDPCPVQTQPTLSQTLSALRTEGRDYSHLKTNLHLHNKILNSHKAKNEKNPQNQSYIEPPALPVLLPELCSKTALVTEATQVYIKLIL